MLIELKEPPLHTVNESNTSKNAELKNGVYGDVEHRSQVWFDSHKPSKIGLSAPTVKILEMLKNDY